jgi:uncharacterized phage-like protein YoqJ
MVLSGFGHRPDEMGGYGIDNIANLVLFAIETLDLYKPTKVISGMSLGWEQALALAALELNIPFIAALPFKNQENVWPEKSQYFYRSLLAKAEHIKTLWPGPFDAKMFWRRDQWIIDRCDGLLVLWQNNEAWQKGELDLDAATTALSLWELEVEAKEPTTTKRRNTDAILSRVLDYADEKSKEIHQLWPQWEEFDGDVSYEGFRESLMGMCLDEL